MKFAIQVASCFLALLAVALADDTLMTWDEFKAKFNKHYNTEEEEKQREKIFMDNRKHIAEHNAKYKTNEVTYMMAINEFSDMTEEEFSKFDLGLKYNKSETGSIANFSDDMSLPVSINWVEKGAVTRVKNQRLCLASYAFSATGAMEGQHFRKTGMLLKLSEQHIIDCSRKRGNRGCLGGSVHASFEYVIKSKGIERELTYPYQGATMQCRFDPTNAEASFTTYRHIPSGDEIALQKAVATIGPISVTVNPFKFILYKSGIYNNPKCTGTAQSHSMLVVGYGIDNATSQEYWLVKNSWGKNWGEEGYMRIARNANNMCGIATMASYPEP